MISCLILGSKILATRHASLRTLLGPPGLWQNKHTHMRFRSQKCPLNLLASDSCCFLSHSWCYCYFHSPDTHSCAGDGEFSYLFLDESIITLVCRSQYKSYSVNQQRDILETGPAMMGGNSAFWAQLKSPCWRALKIRMIPVSPHTCHFPLSPALDSSS